MFTIRTFTLVTEARLVAYMVKLSVLLTLAAKPLKEATPACSGPNAAIRQGLELTL